MEKDIEKESIKPIDEIEIFFRDKIILIEHLPDEQKKELFRVYKKLEKIYPDKKNPKTGIVEIDPMINKELLNNLMSMYRYSPHTRTYHLMKTT